MGTIAEIHVYESTEMNSEDKRVEGRDKGERANGVLSSRSLNKIFPVYALGFERRGGEGDENDDGGDPIWRFIKEEAKLEANEEPILNDFLYSSILSHDCLEHALAFVLANRLQNATLLGTLLMDIFCNVMNDKDIQRAVHLDVQAFKTGTLHVYRSAGSCYISRGITRFNLIKLLMHYGTRGASFCL